MARRRSHWRELQELRRIGEDVARAAQNALEQCVAEVVADTKRLCPVKTGKLRDSIQAERQDGGASFSHSQLNSVLILRHLLKAFGLLLSNAKFSD